MTLAEIITYPAADLVANDGALLDAVAVRAILTAQPDTFARLEAELDAIVDAAAARAEILFATDRPVSVAI